MKSAQSKAVGLTIASVATSVLLFFALALVLTTTMGSIPALIALAVGSIVWTILSAITLWAVRERWSVSTIAISAAISTTVAGMSWGALGGGILLGLLCTAAHRAFIRDDSNIRRFATVSVFRAGTKLLVIGLTLASAGLALPFIEGSLKKDGLQVSPDHLAVVLRPLQPMLKGLTPTVQVESNIDDIIDAQVRQQGGNPNSISAAQRDEIRRQIGQQFAVEISGQESVADIVATKINTTLAGLIQTSSLTVALVTVVIALLTIRAIIPLITWIILIGIAGAAWLSRRVGLLHLKKEMIEVETLTLE